MDLAGEDLRFDAVGAEYLAHLHRVRADGVTRSERGQELMERRHHERRATTAKPRGSLSA